MQNLIKKLTIIMTVLSLILITVPMANANEDIKPTVVGVLVENNATDVAGTELKLLSDKAIEIFPKPSNEVLPLNKTRMAAKLLREENNLANTINYQAPLSKEQYQEIGKELKADYLVIYKVEKSIVGSTISGWALFSTINHTVRVSIDFRILDIVKGKYTETQLVVGESKDSSNVDKLYRKAFEEAISQIKINPII